MTRCTTFSFAFWLLLSCLPNIAAAQEESEVSVDDVEQGDNSETDEDENRVETVLLTPAQLAKLGGAATRLDEEELQANEYDDPTAQVLKVPSVNIRIEDGFGLRPNIGVRGAASDRSKKVTLMEDGILFGPAPYSAPAAYYFPMTNRTVGLEVFKGPAGIRFGPNTIGGAFNWLSRPVPYSTTGGFDLNFGNHLTGKAHGYFGTATKHTGFLIEGIGWGSDGFKELDTGGSTGFNKQEIVAKGRLNSDPAAHVYHELELKIGYSREHSNETYLGLTDEDFAQNPNRRYAASELDNIDWWRTQAVLTYRLDIGGDFDWTTQVYRHDFDRTWLRFNGFEGRQTFDVLNDPTGTNAVLVEILKGNEDSDGIDPLLLSNGRTYVSQGVQSETSWRLDNDDFFNELRAGIRVHYDEVDRLHIEQTHPMVNGRLQAATDSRVATDNRGSALAIAAFVQDTFAIGRFTISPGLRFEWIRTELEDELENTSFSESNSILIPGVGTHVSITKHFGVLGGVYRGFSSVTPRGEDDPKVDPETSLNYEAGFRYADLKNDTLVELVGFWNDYNNLVGDCSFSSGCQIDDLDSQFNAGEARILGLEFVASHRFKTSLFEDAEVPVKLVYTFTHGEFLSDFESSNPTYGSVESGDRLPYLPLHQGALQIGLDTPDWGFQWTSVVVGKTLEQAGPGLETDAFSATDILVKVKVYDPIWVYGKADNIFNVQPLGARRPFGARPIRPFLAQLGVKGEW